LTAPAILKEFGIIFASIVLETCLEGSPRAKLAKLDPYWASGSGPSRWLDHWWTGASPLAQYGLPVYARQVASHR